MPIVIAGGPSVSDYPRRDLMKLCLHGFVFAVNTSSFLFRCDVVVAFDFAWVREFANDLKKLNKPILTRKWDCLHGLGLDLIEMPNEIIYQYPLTGMAACKVSDRMAQQVGKKSYVFGMDATAGHYYNNDGGAHVVDSAVYPALGLLSTVNMGMRSKIDCWPKLSHLPKINKILVHDNYRTMATAWVRAFARRILMNEPLGIGLEVGK